MLGNTSVMRSYKEHMANNCMITYPENSALDLAPLNLNKRLSIEKDDKSFSKNGPDMLQKGPEEILSTSLKSTSLFLIEHIMKKE